MPKIDEVNGFKIVIFSNEPENERPHVHVRKAGKSAKIWLDDLTFAKKGKYNEGDLKKITNIVTERQQIYLAAWNALKN